MRSKSPRSSRKDELEVVIAHPFEAGDLPFEFAVLHCYYKVTDLIAA